jgi:hypothetical protein
LAEQAAVVTAQLVHTVLLRQLTLVVAVAEVLVLELIPAAQAAQA